MVTIAQPRNPAPEHDLPESVCDQNGEEGQPGIGDQARTRRSAREPSGEHEPGSGGESKEGPQSTGDPHSAG